MRGKHCIQKFQFLPFGITPADAGKTQGWNIITGINWDHPRGCGENLPARLKAMQGQGSPPRMRGKLKRKIEGYSTSRITPADAGNKMHSPINNDQSGSPPLMRGKHILCEFSTFASRITPADAGKTTVGIVYRRRIRDHPRRCGENFTFRRNFSNTSGSPPQVRGKPYCHFVFSPLLRITPAGAGKTLKFKTCKPALEDHPRRCGENKA